MIDETILINKFITLITTSVGSLLASQSNNTPAIQRRYKSDGVPAPITNYPCITIDILSRADLSPQGYAELIDVNDNPNYETITAYLISLNSYGPKAGEILTQLHKWFTKVPSFSDSVLLETNGVITTISNVFESPQKLASNYIESASFTLTWVGVDDVTDTTTSTIDTINLILN